MTTDASLVNYLIEKEELVLPLAALRNKMILELDRALSTSIPVNVSDFYKRIANNPGEYFDLDELSIMLQKIQSTMTLPNGKRVSEDDGKIINFLVGIQKLPAENFLELVGPLYSLAELLDDLEKNKEKLSKILKINLFMWFFVNIYELTLHMIDRKSTRLTPVTLIYLVCRLLLEKKKRMKNIS